MNTDAVRAFVARTDALGPPGSDAVTDYWNTVSFSVPDWMTARAAQLHPFSEAYFDLQDQLYTSLRGGPYSGGDSEFTSFDKDAAIASRLAARLFL